MILQRPLKESDVVSDTEKGGRHVYIDLLHIVYDGILQNPRVCVQARLGDPEDSIVSGFLPGHSARNDIWRVNLYRFADPHHRSYRDRSDKSIIY